MGVDAWGVDFALLDKQGVLLDNPVHYRDRRTDGMPEKVIARISKQEIYSQTGIQILPINALFQLNYLVEKQSPVLLNSETFLTIPDLFNYWLVGVKACEFTNATTYMRWLEWSVWNGMFEIKIDGAGGSGEDRPPWKYSEQLQQVFRNVCQLRMEMLPYIYSCANTSYKNGVLMKPLTYMYPNDENTYIIWDEFIFGSAFLIAPVFSEKNEREIYLPQGKWIDYYEPTKEYSGPVKICQSVPFERIPVFIAKNSIYVSGKIYQGNSKTWEGALNGKENLIIHLYPGEINENSQFTYVDYLDGDIEKPMTLQHQAGKILFSSAAIPIPSVISVMIPEKPRKILYGGKVVAFEYDKQNQIAEIACPKDRAIKLEIRY